jgi:hypothetical protein
MLNFIQMKKAILIAALVLGLTTGAMAGEEGHPGLRNGTPHGKGGPHASDAALRGPHKPNPHRMRNVTPYGDFCPNCSVYGVRYKHEAVRHDKAVEAIRAYFAKRGFKIGNVKGLGRFIKVDIYKDRKLVDRIVFDRKTGRIRSIY